MLIRLANLNKSLNGRGYQLRENGDNITVDNEYGEELFTCDNVAEALLEIGRRISPADSPPRPPRPKTPELDRLYTKRLDYQLLIDFTTWLGRTDAEDVNPQRINTPKPIYEICERDPKWDHPDSSGLKAEDFIYAFLKLDPQKIEDERRSLLAWASDYASNAEQKDVK